MPSRVQMEAWSRAFSALRDAIKRLMLLIRPGLVLSDGMKVGVFFGSGLLASLLF